MKSLTLLAVIFIAFALVSCTENDPNPVLTIEGGQIQGVETEVEGIVAYKGVPFAAPPVGELRWREPQPVVPWEGVKIADTYGDAASQTTWDPESFYGREWQASGTAPFTEDCLYLNIWTPAAGQVDENYLLPCGYMVAVIAKVLLMNQKWMAASTMPHEVLFWFR
ncbi:para-nitrobenzyl esterase [Draconibacterium orientale]|uniref:Para-nitrobenzyl esterase n=1 Tax=Draconibacterium orientale TaxID=1168034 RepID=A0A1I0I2K6_9BACT|nr:carboxylesterase family protein [Draconibacterium orientale]SET90443.1 para-nitrobenzyl esterase [Draconibacterium orientale]